MLGMTVSQFFVDFYLSRHLDLTEQASGNIARDLRKFEEWAGGPILLTDLNDDLVLRFLRDRLKAGDSPATVNGRRAKILAVWRCARKLRYVKRRPRAIPRLKEPMRIPRAWTVEQVETLLAYSAAMDGEIGGIPRRLFWPAIELAGYWTGCRPKALLSVRSMDFDPRQNFLIVRAENEKTGRDRFYSLHPQCVEALGRIWDPCLDRLFRWPYCLRYFWTCFRRIVEAAGLPSTKDGRDLFYRLRRTNLSYCAAVDERIAQAQGGHASFTTTRYYLDPSIVRSRSAADVLPVPKINLA